MSLKYSKVGRRRKRGVGEEGEEEEVEEVDNGEEE